MSVDYLPDSAICIRCCADGTGLNSGKSFREISPQAFPSVRLGLGYQELYGAHDSTGPTQGWQYDLARVKELCLG